MNNYIDVLHARQPRLNYVSPAICEAIFSSSSFPTLILEALPVKPPITGTVVQYLGGGNFLLTWNNYPGALCYSVYRLNDANDPFGGYTIIAECISDPRYVPQDWELPFVPGTTTCYLVTAITPEGEVPFGEPICVFAPPNFDEPPPLGMGCILNDTPLPTGTEDSPYTVTLLPNGPADVPQWTIFSGSLPTGLSLNIDTGVISGTPTVPGSYEFVVVLTKNGGGSCAKTFQITISPAPSECPFGALTWEELTPPTDLTISLNDLILSGSGTSTTDITESKATFAYDGAGFILNFDGTKTSSGVGGVFAISVYDGTDNTGILMGQLYVDHNTSDTFSTFVNVTTPTSGFVTLQTYFQSAGPIEDPPTAGGSLDFTGTLSCGGWTGFTWTAGTFGTASITTDGDTANMSVTGTEFVETSGASLGGSGGYSGPEANFILRVTAASLNTPGLGTYLNFSITQDATPLLTVNEVDVTGPFPQEFPFTMAASVNPSAIVFTAFANSIAGTVLVDYTGTSSLAFEIIKVS